MNSSKRALQESKMTRRDFIWATGSTVAAATTLSAQTSSSQGVPWWAARPKGQVGKPQAIDMHSHWSPEPYNKALGELGQQIANPYPLDYDLDKRRKWMDDHGDLMHCLTLSSAMPSQRVTASSNQAP